MLFWCWANVVDGGPASKQHLVNVLCLLDCYLSLYCRSHASTARGGGGGEGWLHTAFVDLTGVIQSVYINEWLRTSSVKLVRNRQGKTGGILGNDLGDILRLLIPLTSQACVRDIGSIDGRSPLGPVSSSVLTIAQGGGGRVKKPRDIRCRREGINRIFERGRGQWWGLTRWAAREASTRWNSWEKFQFGTVYVGKGMRERCACGVLRAGRDLQTAVTAFVSSIQLPPFDCREVCAFLGNAESWRSGGLTSGQHLRCQPGAQPPLGYWLRPGCPLWYPLVCAARWAPLSHITPAGAIYSSAAAEWATSQYSPAHGWLLTSVTYTHAALYNCMYTVYYTCQLYMPGRWQRETLVHSWACVCDAGPTVNQCLIDPNSTKVCTCYRSWVEMVHRYFGTSIFTSTGVYQ